MSVLLLLYHHQVHPRKGKCRVLYDTTESEELDLMTILQSKHLRLVRCPFPEVENAQADMLNRQCRLGSGEQDCFPSLVPKSVQNMAAAVVAKAESTAVPFGPQQQLPTCDDENDAEQQVLSSSCHPSLSCCCGYVLTMWLDVVYILLYSLGRL